MAISATVRSLSDQSPYKGKINFYVITVDSDKVAAEIQRWQGLGTHGLIGTTSAGELKVMAPGHNFGEPLIVSKLDELLKATGG